MPPEGQVSTVTQLVLFHLQIVQSHSQTQLVSESGNEFTIRATEMPWKFIIIRTVTTIMIPWYVVPGVCHGASDSAIYLCWNTIYNILHNDIVTVMQLTWLQCFTTYSDISLLSLQTSPVQDHARGRGAQHVCQQGEGGGGQEHRGSLWDAIQRWVALALQLPILHGWCICTNDRVCRVCLHSIVILPVNQQTIAPSIW